MKTVSCLPDNYCGHFTVDINDKDENIVARSLSILLIALKFPPEEASTAILHFWYSAFLPSSLTEPIRYRILPVIEKVLHSELADSTTLIQSSWSHNLVTLRAALPRETWERLKFYFSESPSVSFKAGLELMQSVTLAHERRDFRDRLLFRLPPS